MPLLCCWSRALGGTSCYCALLRVRWTGECFRVTVTLYANPSHNLTRPPSQNVLVHCSHLPRVVPLNSARASPAKLDLVALCVERGVFAARSAAESAALIAHLCAASASSHEGGGECEADGTLAVLLRTRPARVVDVVCKVLAAPHVCGAALANDVARRAVAHATRWLDTCAAGAVLAAIIPSVSNGDDADAIAAVVPDCAAALDCLLACAAEADVDVRPAMRFVLRAAKRSDVVLSRLPVLRCVIGVESLVAVLTKLSSAAALCDEPRLASHPALRLACVEIALASTVEASDVVLLTRTRLELVAQLSPIELLEIDDVAEDVFVSVLRALRSSASAAALAALEWQAREWESSCTRVAMELRAALERRVGAAGRAADARSLLRIGCAIAHADGTPNVLLRTRRLWLEMMSAIVDATTRGAGRGGARSSSGSSSGSLELELATFLLSAVGSRPAVLRKCLAELFEVHHDGASGDGDGDGGGGVGGALAFPTAQLQRIVASSLATFEADNRLQVAAARACVAAERRGVRAVAHAEAHALNALPSRDWEEGHSARHGAGQGHSSSGALRTSDLSGALQHMPLHLRSVKPRMLPKRAREIATEPVHESAALFPF